jgi:hypothetical protein
MTGQKFESASDETMALMRKIGKENLEKMSSREWGKAENMIHWADDGQLLGYGESDTTGCWLKIRILPEDLDKFRGLKGTIFYWTAVELAEDGQPVENITTGSSNGKISDFDSDDAGSTPAPVTKPYGKEASELYKNGFFLVPAVLAAIGTDQEYLNWLKMQKCAARRLGGCNGDVVAAHIRRINAGAGMGIKPGEYSAIPLCHAHHSLQHTSGENALVEREK